MQGITGVGYSARSYFEQNVLRVGSSYQDTINGLSRRVRLNEQLHHGETAMVEVHYGHVVDTYA